MIIKENKIITKYEYKSLAKLKKEFNCKGIPSPSKVLSHKSKQASFFQQVIHNKNHALHETLKTSLADGRNVHNMLEKNKLDKEKHTQEQNELYQAVQECFKSDLEPLITEIWGREQGLIIPNQYGGKFDSVGKIQGTDMVWDYKKINKRKTKSQIKNYIMQSAAYAQAHNSQYGTDIKDIAIMTIYGKKADDVGSNIFIINSNELKEYTKEFNNKVKQYYKDNGTNS